MGQIPCSTKHISSLIIKSNLSSISRLQSTSDTHWQWQTLSLQHSHIDWMTTEFDSLALDASSHSYPVDIQLFRGGGGKTLSLRGNAPPPAGYGPVLK